jgi:hypothetical protein
VVLPDVAPDDPIARCLQVQLRLQQRGLSEAEDQALRTLRDRPARLAWDLQTLGTTPDVRPDHWAQTRALLAVGARREVLERWSRGFAERARDLAAVHVRAVLYANQLAWQASRDGRADDETMEGYVAHWPVLLHHKDWIESFARQRCTLWRAEPPNAAERRRLIERVSAVVANVLRSGCGGEERWAEWSRRFERERAAIEVVGQACRRDEATWPLGFGPLGVRALGEQESARAWLFEQMPVPHAALPLTALRTGRAGIFKLKPEHVATGAAAIQWLFSESLGAAAAEVWRGQGASALAALERASDCGVARAAAASDAWFGSGPAAARQLRRGLAELRAEALLLLVRDGLSRPEVSVDELSETVARLLVHADALKQPQVVVEQVEQLLSGRVQACLEGRLPRPDEVAHVLEAGLQLRTMLLGRGAGQRCSQDLAQLLLRRAVVTWNRPRGIPSPRALARVYSDLYQAADLAPHNADVAVGLANVILQVYSGARAAGEQRSLLEKAWAAVERCRNLGGASLQLEECRAHLREILEPEAAMAETRQKLEQALRPRRDRPPAAGNSKARP